MQCKSFLQMKNLQPSYGSISITPAVTEILLWCQILVKYIPYAVTVISAENDYINPFQSNFSANRILPSSYLFTPFIPAIFLQAQPREYNTQSPVHIRETERVKPYAICWPKSVLHEEKRRTDSDSRAGATKTCRTSSDIGAERKS